MIGNVKGLCQAAYMDLRRNAFLKAALAAMSASYAAVMLLGRERMEETVWTAYAACSILMALSLPLVYHSRLSDKNRKIIQAVVRTKTASGILYGLLFDLFLAGIFGVAYICMCIIAGIVLTGKAISAYLIASVCLELAIYVMLCHACFEAANKYVAGLVAYLILVIGLLVSNQVFLGILCPLEYHIYGVDYFIGKFVEMILLAALNVGLSVRRRMR